MSAATPQAPPLPAAELDRRFYAFAIDRLIAWTLVGIALLAAYQLFLADGQVVAGLALVLVALLLLMLAFAVLLGLRGVSPGKAALGLRVVGPDSGEPIGLVPAILRGLLLGLASLPTFGLGLATLAWTALTDPGRQRRGWHDRVADSVVVDVRPQPVEEERVEEAPRQIVNLTAMRLVPAPAPTTTVVPAARPSRPPATWGDPVPEATPPARWRVGFDTGEELLVESPVLVGRSPEPRPDEEVSHLVALPSEDMSLSKTHVQLHVARDGVLVVTDRGSTNGSVLVRSGVARELPAGKTTTLLPGDVVRFGDRQMTVSWDS